MVPTYWKLTSVDLVYPDGIAPWSYLNEQGQEIQQTFTVTERRYEQHNVNTVTGATFDRVYEFGAPPSIIKTGQSVSLSVSDWASQPTEMNRQHGLLPSFNGFFPPHLHKMGETIARDPTQSSVPDPPATNQAVTYTWAPVKISFTTLSFSTDLAQYIYVQKAGQPPARVPLTLTWTGDGDGVNWSDAANWQDSGGHHRPQNGDTLIFPETAHKSPVNDMPGLSLEAIYFKAPDYNVTGEPVRVRLGVSSQTTGETHYSLDTTLTNSGPSTFYAKPGGDLVIGAAVTAVFGFIISGGGEVTLAHDSAAPIGAIRVKESMLSVAAPNAAGFGNIVLINGTLRDELDGAPLTLANTVIVRGNVAFDSNGHSLGLGTVNVPLVVSASGSSGSVPNPY